MTDYPSDAILGRYFAGELSPAELAELQRWVTEDPTHEARVELLRDLWMRAGQMPSDRDMESAWHDVSNRLGISENDEHGPSVSVAAAVTSLARRPVRATRDRPLSIVPP